MSIRDYQMKNYWLGKYKKLHCDPYQIVWDWNDIHVYDTLKESVQCNFNIRVLDIMDLLGVTHMHAGSQIVQLWQLNDCCCNKNLIDDMIYHFRVPVYEYNWKNALLMAATRLPITYPSGYASIEIKNLDFLDGTK
jgi:hypothetical protein